MEKSHLIRFAEWFLFGIIGTLCIFNIVAQIYLFITTGELELHSFFIITTLMILSFGIFHTESK